MIEMILTKERKIQILDLAVLMALFMLGGICGKDEMKWFSDPVFGFNAVAIGVVLAGELIWKVAKRIFL